MDGPPPCSIEGCQTESKVRTYCFSHYGKLLREGQLVVRIPLTRTLRVCELCVAEYTPRSIEQRYCGLICGSTSRNPLHRPPRACLSCFTVFKPPEGGASGKQKYCSRGCIPGRLHGPPLPHECKLCKGPYAGRLSKFCGKDCAKRAKRQRDKHRKGSVIPIHELIELENNICYLCKEECGPKVDPTHPGWKKSPTVEHVIPRSKGGTDTWDNVRLADVSCNSKKQAKVPTN